MRHFRAPVILAWAICAIAGTSTIFNLYAILSREAGRQTLLHLVSNQFANTGYPLIFAIPGALIISRHPRQVIGWLLVGPALVFSATSWITSYLQGFSAAPPATFWNLFMLWFSTCSWLALILPLILMVLLFPTGRLLSPRWNWTIYLAVGMVLFFFFWAAFSKLFQVEFVSWSLINPIGFLAQDFDQWVIVPWSGLLVLLTIASLVSVVLRFRRAPLVEREQLKWLLYAGMLFALVYSPGMLLGGLDEANASLQTDLLNILFGLATMAIPAAIAVAILRYHLFDIDVIIRLTLIYALLSGVLGLVFAAGIVLAQGAFITLTGQRSPAAEVITTLATIALFQPLRRRIQLLINRRFYRESYSAEQALAQFTRAARSGSDLDELAAMLIEIAQGTLQPTQVSLELKTGEQKQER
jgi:hypothetical protein